MGKAIMFFAFMWVICSIAGGVLSGEVTMASTHLTADITANSTAAISVASTTGFPEPGIIQIGDERIAYASTTATTFKGNLASPLIRGTQSTTSAAHSAGDGVRTREGSMLNAAIDYHIATLTDAAGVMAFVQIPIAVFGLIKNFVASPLSFLGTDLEILSVFWMVMVLGLVVSVAMAVIGGRRV